MSILITFFAQLRSVSALRPISINYNWLALGGRWSDKKFQNHQPDSLYFLCFVTAGDQTRAQRGTLLESSSESRSAPFISSLKVISTKACQPFSLSPSLSVRTQFFGGGGKSCTKDSFTWPGAVKIGETLSAWEIHNCSRCSSVQIFWNNRNLKWMHTSSATCR